MLIVFSIVLFLLKHFKLKKSFTLIVTITFVLIGISAVKIQNPKSYSNFYFNKNIENKSVILEIQKVLKPGNYYTKHVAKVIQVNNKETQGKILLNIKKEDTLTPLKVGQLLYLAPNFKELIPPLNPHQFDYKNYLAKQHIYHQIFTEDNQYKIVGYNHSVFSYIAEIRNTIQFSLKQYHFSKNELAVINALLLGQRQDISKELLQDYTNAGAIHILAISGLHIGIILLILSYLFKPLEKLPRGKIISTFLIVFLLWLFALLAGLNASVVRAVTMFTFVAIGQSFQQKQPIEHSLVTSMFILLLVNPIFLFDVGFQLSYLAVFGIVWTRPLLYNLWKPKWKIIDKFWQLLTVSIAAQAGILPISLYYFHQFPSLFIFSNLLIIPFLGGILIGGILIILLAITNLLPQFLANIYGFVIYLMNSTVNFIAKKEDFLLKEIPMSFIEMIAWYLVIISIIQLVTTKRIKQFSFVLLSIICLQVVLISEKNLRKKKSEFIVFHKSRKTLIGNRISSRIDLFHNLDKSITTDKLIVSYRTNENVTTHFTERTPNIFFLKKDTIIAVDSLGVYNFGIQNPIVVLQHSPKINLNRLLRTISPKKIIADGSNYKSYINRWESTCKKQQTPFYYTGQNGAFVIY
ncbi:competence protein [Tenacibaculum holothuriorum]|uniref:Competence protein n=1 Tax=Tenacibaculum holothuriorum TaxID=1635173 RepID=A0A1Y2PCK4_9FLAO|nr:competence protein [Tenacibaculum holothuriorum]